MFTVRWKLSARDQLTELWVQGVNRQAITSAANAIDADLASNPLAVGESRTATRRILIVPPLVIDYTVQLQERTVYVLKVRQLPQQGSGAS